MFEMFHSMLHVFGLCPEVIGISSMPNFVLMYRNVWVYMRVYIKSKIGL
jgi:hypothetical protein